MTAVNEKQSFPLEHLDCFTSNLLAVLSQLCPPSAITVRVKVARINSAAKASSTDKIISRLVTIKRFYPLKLSGAALTWDSEPKAIECTPINKLKKDSTTFMVNELLAVMVLLRFQLVCKCYCITINAYISLA
jgi:hypothetical protein